MQLTAALLIALAGTALAAPAPAPAPVEAPFKTIEVKFNKRVSFPAVIDASIRKVALKVKTDTVASLDQRRSGPLRHRLCWGVLPRRDMLCYLQCLR